VWFVALVIAAILIRPRQLRRRQFAAPVSSDASEVLNFDSEGFPLVIDSRTKCVSYLDRELSLSPKPFLLLELLVRDYGRVFNDQEIIEHVWTDTPYVNSNDVRQCVYRLRCRLNDVEAGLGDCIANVKGFGYRFDPTRLQTTP
jgi:DNA-binding winged helix-turn-helix (wHTH) protein